MAFIRMEVKGLKQALANLDKVGKEIGTKALRASLLSAALIINRAVKSATYTTFVQRSGAIRAGMGVRVGRELKDDRLSAVIVEFERTNTSGPLLKSARERIAKTNVAYWWRFLEFGTANRRAAKTPKASRSGRIQRGRKHLLATARYAASASVGDVAARPWVRPAFSATAQQAVEKFRADLRATLEREVNNLSKGDQS